jgi:F0F1-type ATP synthase assembly protein I
VENQDPSHTPAHQNNDAKYYRLAFRILVDFGATLAIPALVSAFLGIWLDRHLGTKPWILIVCLFIGFTLTWMMILRKARLYAKDFERIGKERVV